MFELLDFNSFICFVFGFFVGIIFGVIFIFKMKFYICSIVDFISLWYFIVGYFFDVYFIIFFFVKCQGNVIFFEIFDYSFFVFVDFFLSFCNLFC